MQTPIRVLLALRPAVRIGLLVALAVSTVVFTATPFLLPAVAGEFDVSVGTASTISTVQLAGFVAGSWIAGQRLEPSQGLLRAALAGLALANLASALSPGFVVLLVCRLIAGGSLGLVSWLAWVEAFGDTRRTSDVAVVGPLIGVLGAPPLAWIASAHGARWLYATLAVLAVAAVALPGHPAGTIPQGGSRRSRPVPAAAALLAALFLLTAGGSSVFVFGAALGEDRAGLSAGVVALAFSVNAGAGVPSARWKGVRRYPGGWVATTALCAFTLGAATDGLIFFAAMALWGFCFWMGVPGAFSLLAARSAHPAERAGDAQAVMAAGRVVGPLMGAVAFNAGSPVVLGMTGGSAMLVAAAIITYVELVLPPRS